MKKLIRRLRRCYGRTFLAPILLTVARINTNRNPFVDIRVTACGWRRLRVQLSSGANGDKRKTTIDSEEAEEKRRRKGKGLFSSTGSKAHEAAAYDRLDGCVHQRQCRHSLVSPPG